MYYKVKCTKEVFIMIEDVNLQEAEKQVTFLMKQKKLPEITGLDFKIQEGFIEGELKDYIQIGISESFANMSFNLIGPGKNTPQIPPSESKMVIIQRNLISRLKMTVSMELNRTPINHNAAIDN